MLDGEGWIVETFPVQLMQGWRWGRYQPISSRWKKTYNPAQIALENKDLRLFWEWSKVTSYNS